MNKKMLFVLVGTALVAGCRSEVMSDRQYVPAPGAETTPAMTPAAAAPAAPAAAAPAAPEVKAPAPQTTEFAPMTSAPAPKAPAVSKSAPAGGTYTVQSGDTLGKIAQIHHVRLAALMQANNLDSKSANRLKIGQKLVIPGGKAVASAPRSAKAGKAAKSAKSAKVAVSVSADGTYTVQSGDTPQRIAKKLGCKLSDLMKANNMTEEQARRLKIGQKLSVPGKSAAAATASAPAADAAAPAPAAAPAAADAAAPVAADPVAADPAVVPAADAAAPAEAPATTNTDIFEVPADTTAAEIAKKYNISVEELCKLNNNLSADASIKKGEVIFVPAAK